MVGQVIFEGKTKQDKQYVIRYPQEGDAQAMCDYINELSQEHTYIRFQGETVSLEDETKYLQEQLEKIRKNKTVQLLVICEGKIMGISAIDLKDKTESHEGVFGISLAKDIRGEGIGKILMKLTIEEAEKHLSELRLITLGVFGDNQLAFKMYEDFDFQEYGRLPGGSLHDGNYVDHVYMYKKIR